MTAIGYSHFSLQEYLNATRRQGASAHLVGGCPCRLKTRSNENANVKAAKEKADNILSYRNAWGPCHPPAWGAPPPPPAQDISTMTDMVTELTRPVDRAQLDHKIKDFNPSVPVNVDDALNAFTLPP